MSELDYLARNSVAVVVLNEGLGAQHAIQRGLPYHVVYLSYTLLYWLCPWVVRADPVLR